MTRAERIEEALMSWVAQHGCACGHPACKRCRDTREAEALLALPVEPVASAAPAHPACMDCGEPGTLYPFCALHAPVESAAPASGGCERCGGRGEVGFWAPESFTKCPSCGGTGGGR